MAEVGGTRKQGFPKGQIFSERNNTPRYVILSPNLLLSQFTCFLKGFCSAFDKNHPAFTGLSAKVYLLSESFLRAFGESAFGELSTRASLLVKSFLRSSENFQNISLLSVNIQGAFNESQFCFHRSFNECQIAFKELSTKVSLLSYDLYCL